MGGKSEKKKKERCKQCERADVDWKYVARIGPVSVHVASACITKTTCLLTDSEDQTCLVEILANFKKANICQNYSTSSFCLKKDAVRFKYYHYSKRLAEERQRLATN
jgi:hypothetical protein